MEKKPKLCGHVLERTPLSRGGVDSWDDDRRRGVYAFGGPDVVLGVVGGLVLSFLVAI